MSKKYPHAGEYTYARLKQMDTVHLKVLAGSPLLLVPPTEREQVRQAAWREIDLRARR